MLTTHAIGFATTPPIAFCSFVVGFIIDDLKKKRVTLSGTMAIISHGQTMNVIKQNDGIAR